MHGNTQTLLLKTISMLYAHKTLSNLIYTDVDYWLYKTLIVSVIQHNSKTIESLVLVKTVL